MNFNRIPFAWRVKVIRIIMEEEYSSYEPSVVSWFLPIIFFILVLLIAYIAGRRKRIMITAATQPPPIQPQQTPVAFLLSTRCLQS